MRHIDITKHTHSETHTRRGREIVSWRLKNHAVQWLYISCWTGGELGAAGEYFR